MELSRYVDGLIYEKLLDNPDDNHLQTEIHPEINFKFNSINLLISRRGVGKTFTVMTELIKLSQLQDCANYTTFLYVSDKTNDETINNLIPLLKLQVKIVSYENVLGVLTDLIDAKSAYADLLKKDLQEVISESVKKDLFTTLNIKTFVNEVPHTAILLDDAINVLKDCKFKALRNLLFQNRQPRLTIFICAQDIFGVPPQIRRNCDTVWIFAGLTDKSMFGMMMAQLGVNGKDVWSTYSQLKHREVLIIDYTSNGIKIKIKRKDGL
jgi:hypothetical protein